MSGGLNELREIAHQLDKEHLAALRARRDALILEAVSAGERPTDIARAAGVSREWIYRLKNETEARSTLGSGE